MREVRWRWEQLAVALAALIPWLGWSNCFRGKTVNSADDVLTTQKLLVLSDIHYPAGRSREAFSIIRKERPDIVVLLGDVVEAPKDALVKYYREFLDNYPFQLESTALILGDNDFAASQVFRDFVGSLDTLTANHDFFKCGNLFMTHGNIEGRGRFSPLLETMGSRFAKKLQSAMPSLLSRAVRVRYSVACDDYLFLGHIHYLGKVSSTNSVFCGTFSTEKIVYPAELSLGYVTAELARSRVVDLDSIVLHHLKPAL